LHVRFKSWILASGSGVARKRTGGNVLISLSMHHVALHVVVFGQTLVNMHHATLHIVVLGDHRVSGFENQLVALLHVHFRCEGFHSGRVRLVVGVWLVRGVFDIVGHLHRAALFYGKVSCFRVT
jgi:hypothetical protein